VTDEQLLHKIEQDLYFGNGKPALTIRIEVTEEKVETINRNLSKLVWLALGTAASSVGALVVALIAHFSK
jgi:hypothetical protein